MRTAKKEILLFLLSSWVKLRTEFFWKVFCNMLISLISLARISKSSTYLRYIGSFLMLLNILFKERKKERKKSQNYQNNDEPDIGSRRVGQVQADRFMGEKN